MIRVGTRFLGFLVVLLVAFPAASAFAAETPGPPAYVLDAAHVLRPEVVQQISGELASFELRTAHQLAVVTVPDLQGEDVERYSRDLFDAWGIGRPAQNDGGLLLVAVTERRVRVQVGQGLRDLGLSDDAAVRVVDDITPTLHENDFDAGLLAGEREIRRTVGDAALDARADGRTAHFGGGHAIAADADAAAAPGARHERTNPIVVAAVLAVFGILVSVLITVGIIGIRRDRALGGGDAAGAGAGWGGYSGGGFSGGGGGGGGAAGGGGGASGGF